MRKHDPELDDFTELDAEAVASALAAFETWEEEWWREQGTARWRPAWADMM